MDRASSRTARVRLPLPEGDPYSRLGRWIRTSGVRAAERVTTRTFLEFEYPPTAEESPRWGFGKPPNQAMLELLSPGEDRYAAVLGELLDFVAELRGAATDREWLNSWFAGLDAVALYGFLRSRRAHRYVEVGGGASTRFAALAREHGDRELRITTIDPNPRPLDVGFEPDVHIEAPLESAGLEPFGELEPGDVVLLDGTHRAFMNSDVTVFFCEVLPALRPGVLVGIHDVYLPDDYPPHFAQCHWSEQYLLAALLLGGDRWKVELPAWYVSTHTMLLAEARHGALVETEGSPARPDPASFWIQSTAPPPLRGNVTASPGGSRRGG